MSIGVVVDSPAWDTSVCFPVDQILRGVRQVWAS